MVGETFWGKKHNCLLVPGRKLSHPIIIKCKGPPLFISFFFFSFHPYSAYWLCHPTWAPRSWLYECDHQCTGLNTSCRLAELGQITTTNSKHSSLKIPGTGPSVLYILSCVMLTTAPKGKYWSYCHYAAEKTEAQRSWVSCSQLHAKMWWFWTQIMWFQPLCSLHSAKLTLVKTPHSRSTTWSSGWRLACVGCMWHLHMFYGNGRWILSWTPHDPCAPPGNILFFVICSPWISRQSQDFNHCRSPGKYLTRNSKVKLSKKKKKCSILEQENIA